MIYLYYVFIICFVLNLFYILKEDIETKYIPLVGFYIFMIFGIIYYIIEFAYIGGIIILLICFFIIFSLDIIEHFKKEISFLGKSWKILDTGVYDYFLYLYILVLIFSSIFLYIGSMLFIFLIFIPFIFSFIIGIIGLKIHQKKVDILIHNEQISDYESLDQALYDRKLQKISLKDLKTKINLNTKQQDLKCFYSKRVPLFLFGNSFIFGFIITKNFI